MPGSEINTIENELNAEMGDNEQILQPIEEIPQNRGIGINLDFLKTPTGSGSIEDYMEHPLNFSKSRGLSRIIRGMTGMLGALDLAIIDIALGLLEFLREKKKPAAGGQVNGEF